MSSILRLIAIVLLTGGLFTVALPALGAENAAPQSDMQLALKQSNTLDEKTCSCSTGIGACHIIYRFAGSTCEKRAREGETECTGTCAFRSSPSSRGGSGGGIR